MTVSWMRDAHAGRFLLRRALRLLPGLFVAMWILAPVLAWLRPEAFAWTRDLLHPWSALVVVTIIGATALAWLSWHLVERRALTLKPRGMRPVGAPTVSAPG